MVYMHVVVQMKVLYLAYTMYIMYMYCWAYGCDIMHIDIYMYNYNNTCRWVHFHLQCNNNAIALPLVNSCTLYSMCTYMYPFLCTCM